MSNPLGLMSKPDDKVNYTSLNTKGRKQKSIYSLKS
jgi:hypothetical protein